MPLRWGVAGYGDIVRKRALPALLSLGETVTCVWGRDAARAQRTCDEFGTGFGTSDYGKLLDTVDVVYVATPVATHVPLAVAAARAGLPVLMEKPLGALPALAEQPLGGLPTLEWEGPGGSSAPEEESPGGSPLLAELAAAHVGVAYYRRLAPAVRRALDLLRGRAIHEVAVDCRGPFDPGPDDPKLWRTDPALSGGGVLADVGSHRLDLLCLLLGEPAVTGARTGRRFPLGAERDVRARLAWPAGATGEVRTVWGPEPRRDHLRLAFDGGHLELDPLDSGNVRGTVDGVTVEEFLPPPANLHIPLMADFARSVRDGSAPICPVRDAFAVDRLISAVYAAATPLEEDT
ncbi:Gfo/Idh/MocA family oxidoreductase [Nonomuraea glycinis]|uniref:NADH-dependent dehydrogenase n=1 Tax=Nonomuraea glycinis TaxID=2047744 RepID=A0A918EAL1_9ACTN|nr:Gfo/Idh/MocA family oxidoreductase [Nonomuraea glycinis]MCA2181823.1 Gfo/Idh/MocA family oxidoreductase [Nonomuraea glycinis]GGP15664.1 NADH-dependent dehydrogenase [Nonomuraea glycinis]